MAVLFNGVNSSLDAASVPGGTGTIDFSVVMWMKSLDQTFRQFPFIMGNSNNGERAGMDAFDGDGQCKAYTGGNAPASILMTPGVWYHVALCYSTNSSALCVYINGVLSSTLPSAMNLGNVYFTMGSRQNIGQWAKIQLAEVAKYDADFSNSGQTNPTDLISFAAGFSPLYLFPTTRKFYSRLLTSTYFIDQQRGLALTPIALADADHPRIYA